MDIEEKHYRIVTVTDDKTGQTVSNKWYERTFECVESAEGVFDPKPVDTFIRKEKFREAINMDECTVQNRYLITETSSKTGVIVREQWLAEAEPGEEPALHSEDGAAIIVRDPLSGRIIYQSDFTFGFEHQTRWNVDLPENTP